MEFNFSEVSMVFLLKAFRSRAAAVGWSVVAASVSLGIGGAAHAATVTTMIAEDSFSYTAGMSLTGQTGGAGWSGAWVSDSISFTDFRTSASSLVVPGVTSAGGSMVFVAAGTQINDAARTLPLQNSGVVFIQFLSQFGTQSGGGTPSIRLVSSGAGTGAIGNNGGCGSAVYAIMNAGLATIAASCSSVSLNTLSAVVVRIDYAANVTRMWVLPSLVGFDYLNPPAPSAEYAGLAPAFDRISVYSRNPATLDELRVFRVASAAPADAQAVPALSPGALMALTALLLLGGWRLIRRHSAS